MRRGARICLACLLTGFVPAVQASDATTASARHESDAEVTDAQFAPDDEFLEFLGSIDTDEADEDWLDYLARTDIAKMARAKRKAPDATEVEK